MFNLPSVGRLQKFTKEKCKFDFNVDLKKIICQHFVEIFNIFVILDLNKLIKQ